MRSLWTYITFVAPASRLLNTSSSTTLVRSDRMMPERNEFLTDSGNTLMLLIEPVYYSDTNKIIIFNYILKSPLSDINPRISPFTQKSIAIPCRRSLVKNPEIGKSYIAGNPKFHLFAASIVTETKSTIQLVLASNLLYRKDDDHSLSAIVGEKLDNWRTLNTHFACEIVRENS